MKRLLPFLGLCLCLFTSAQVIDFSTPGKLPARTGKFKIIGKNNDGIVVRLFGTEDVINIYGDDLKLSSSKTIAFKNQDGLLQHIMLNKTGAVVFYLSQDKKFSVLFAQPVNSKFIEIGKPVSIDTIYDRKDLVASNLRFKSSVDQNFLFVYYPFFGGSNIQSVKFICIDHALNVQYNKTVPMNRSESEMQESKSFIDNDGNSFLLLKPESKTVSEQFDVFRVSRTGELATYSIYTPRGAFGETVFEVDNKNGNLVMCAFYNDEKGRGEEAAHGFIYARYNPATGQQETSSVLPFTPEFMIELTGRASTEQRKLYTFNIKKILLRNDGGAVILAESFIKDTRESTGAIGIQPGFTTYRTSTIYQFNDIIAFSISPEGTAEWNTVLRKKQVSEDDNGNYSSFLIMNEKDKLHLVYLDDITYAGGLNDYTLSTDGKAERKELMSQADRDIMLLPKSGRQISPKEAIMPSYRNGILQLIKITY